jgi:hypothetical protein
VENKIKWQRNKIEGNSNGVKLSKVIKYKNDLDAEKK